MKAGQKISKNVEKVFFYVKSTHNPYTIIGNPLGLLPPTLLPTPLVMGGFTPDLRHCAPTVAQIWAKTSQIWGRGGGAIDLRLYINLEGSQ